MRTHARAAAQTAVWMPFHSPWPNPKEMSRTVEEGLPVCADPAVRLQLIRILKEVVPIHIVVVPCILVVIEPVVALVIHVIVISSCVQLIVIIVVEIIVVAILTEGNRCCAQQHQGLGHPPGTEPHYVHADAKTPF